MRFHVFVLIFLLLATPFAAAETVSYEFEISTLTLNVTGKNIQALAIDGQVPAPTLRARVGDTLRATFHNTLDEATSVHWHGILLPADQDGVSYLNTTPIAAGTSHTFEFPITHAGTFWYHSHTNLQIQRGLYGGIILEEATGEAEWQDELILFSDWTDTRVERVLKNLKSDDDFYAFDKNNVQSWDRVIAYGPEAIRNRLNSSLTRMGPMDLADVNYDAFLANGEREGHIVLHDDAAGQIKLRLVNGSTSSYYDVEYAGGPMTVIAADGQNVEPLRVQRLRISTAETYDVLVPTQAGTAFELRANSFDGSGFSSVFVGTGERELAPDLPRPNLFLVDHSAMDMSGMDADHSMHQSSDSAMDRDEPSASDHDGHSQHQDHSAHTAESHANGISEEPEANHEASDQHTHNHETLTTAEPDHSMHHMQEAEVDHSSHVMPPSETDHSAHDMAMSSEQQTAEVIAHMTDYSKLVALHPTELPQDQEWRDIRLSLSGAMERYVWSFNGKTFRESPQIVIKKGENVRFHFNNETMMHHPLHLHGHFFRVVNQAGDRSPLKHTVNVPPMGEVTIEFDANEDQDWLFHCHNQYHMKSGMNRVVSYENSSNFNATIEKQLQASQRFFQVNEFHLLTSFADYEVSLFDDRHEFRFELETDISGRHEELATYNYHFGRFLSGFVGYQGRHHETELNRDTAIAGINLTLPLLIDSEWRIDEEGDFRLELESELALTKNWAVDWRWNTDNEYRYGLNYRLNNRWSFTVHKDKEYGSGVGFKFFY